MSIQEIIKELLAFVGSDIKQNWYVGIATDPEERLFVEHNVSKQLGICNYWKADSEDDARYVENLLLNTYSFKGGPGGGKCPKYVYVYKITSTTNEG